MIPPPRKALGRNAPGVKTSVMAPRTRTHFNRDRGSRPGPWKHRRGNMKKTVFADPLYYASAGREFSTDLETGIDTSKSGYNAWIRWTVIATRTSGTGPSAKVRVLRIPFMHSVTIPFNLGEAIAEDLLNKFFDAFQVLVPTGTTLTSNQGDAEPIGSIKAAIAAIVNLVDTPDEDNEDQVDEDVTENE